jgi:hypothetical protein
VKVTLNVHELAAARVVPQPLDPLPAALKFPLALNVKLNPEELLLVSVTMRGGLVVPTFVVPNANAAGAIKIGGTPVPLTPTNDGVFGRELVMVTSPGTEPVSEGTKATLITQVPLGCNVAPEQVLLWA